MSRVIDTTESQIAVRQTGQHTLAANGTAPAPLTAMDILARAVESGRSADELAKLIELADRMASMGAAREFAAAMAQFKRECPPVPRRAENSQFQVTRNGAKVNRRYASLEDIEATIREPLGRNGLSYRWGTAVIGDGKMTVACIVSHAGGHSVESSVTLPTDSTAGCSAIQKYGAAMTYAQRYSLVQALGLTSCDEDNDGNDQPRAETITEHQAANLEAEIAELRVDRSRILTFAGVDRLADIPAALWPRIRAKLDEKRNAIKNGGGK